MRLKNESTEDEKNHNFICRHNAIYHKSNIHVTDLFVSSQSAVTWDTQCGITKGCFPDCKDSGCSYLVTWQVPSGQDSVQFEIFVEESGSSWVGVAFSSDDDMVRFSFASFSVVCLAIATNSKNK